MAEIVKDFINSGIGVGSLSGYRGNLQQALQKWKRPSHLIPLWTSLKVKKVLFY